MQGLKFRRQLIINTRIYHHKSNQISIRGLTQYHKILITVRISGILRRNTFRFRQLHANDITLINRTY